MEQREKEFEIILCDIHDAFPFSIVRIPHIGSKYHLKFLCINRVRNFSYKLLVPMKKVISKKQVKLLVMQTNLKFK